MLGSEMFPLVILEIQVDGMLELLVGVVELATFSTAVRVTKLSFLGVDTVIVIVNVPV